MKRRLCRWVLSGEGQYMGETKLKQSWLLNRHRLCAGLFSLAFYFMFTSCGGEVQITTHIATLASIAVTPVNPSIAGGTTQQFTALGVFSDGSTQNLTTTVTWSSSDTAAVTISNAAGSQGLATATTAGTSTITAVFGGKTASTTLTVTSATLVSIAVTPVNPSIANTTTQQFTVRGTFSDSSTQDLTTAATWGSATASVATISSAAGSQGLATAIGAGTTVISAAYGGKTDSTTLTVRLASALTSIAVTPANPTIANGSTEQFTATGTYSDSSTLDVTASVTWSSSDTGVATISDAAGFNGLATPISFGTTTITATLGGISGATILNISPPVMPSGAPQVLYTDIVAGPVAGGENNKGAYLSLFGKNFGSTGLGSTVKVYINNVEVDNYRYGASKGRSDIQQITVQVGALGNPASGVALPIKVVVNGVSSNTDQTFTVQPGGFLFVDPVSGNDSTAVKNDITHPWKNVQTSSGYDSGAIGKTVPGDTIVLRGGNYTGDGWDGYWLKFYNFAGNAPTGAAGHGYIAVLGYPTETIYIHPTSPTNYGVISGGGSAYHASYIVIANVKVEGGSSGNTTFHDGPVNLQVLSDYWRVVNNELLSPYAPFDAKAGGIAGDGRYDKFLGNNIHDTGEDQSNSNEENHGIYIDAGNDYEVAYNVIHDIPGGSAFQTFNSSGTTSDIHNVLIHHNLIYNVTNPHGKHGINIGDTSSTGFAVYDNILYHIARGGIRFNTQDLHGCKIYNNTLYDIGFYNNSPLYTPIMSDWNLPSDALDVKNNIIWPSSGIAYTGGAVGVDNSNGTFSNNLWYGGSGSSPSFDGTKVTANPQFSNAAGGDFHLQSSSPAIDKGNSAVSGLVTNDFDITTSRPQGTAYDIGAFEYAP